MVIKDRYNRLIRNLRVAVTPRCNLRCPFCHAEGEIDSKDLMSPEEIYQIVKIATGIGIRRVKITGGEPLLRKDIVDILRKIRELEIQDCSMTTNGTRLAPVANDLVEAGLNRINISLPSLDPTKYASLVGGNLQSTLDGIDQAISSGLKPVKINVLLLRDINVVELPRMIEFASQKGAVLQLIELEPLNTTQNFFNQYHVDLDEIENTLKQQAESIKIRHNMQNRKLYILPTGTVEVIQPIDNPHFCAACSRLRITSDGKIKPCLMRQDNHVDILSAIKAKADTASLTQLFLSAIQTREPFYQNPPE